MRSAFVMFVVVVEKYTIGNITPIGHKEGDPMGRPGDVPEDQCEHACYLTSYRALRISYAIIALASSQGNGRMTHV